MLILQACGGGASKSGPVFQTSSSAAFDALGKPVEVRRAEVTLRPDRHIPYKGNTAITRSDFPLGFPRSMGSGISFKGKHDDTLEFWVVGDRGPNGEGPEVAGQDSKLFPDPGFAPAFGVLEVSPKGAVLVSTTDMVAADGSLTTGLPHPRGSQGATGEVALSESLTELGYDANGTDSEAIAWDGGSLWVSDEYGPFVIKLDPTTGRIVEKLAPGRGLPEVFAKRRVNRGMELLTYDGKAHKLYGALQSPIDDGSVEVDGKSVKVRDGASFIRWVEIDPATQGLREFAYPVDPADYRKSETGQAKLGDLAALDNGRFVVIEQGRGSGDDYFHRLFVVDAVGATDIHAFQTSDLERSSILGFPVDQADWKTVKPLRKTLLLDLDRLGWTAEKAEGLALVDERTLALSNDNDYGMTTTLLDAGGQRLSGKVEHCQASGQGGSVFGEKCPKHAASVAAVSLPDEAMTQHFWLIRFAQPIRDY